MQYGYTSIPIPVYCVENNLTLQMKLTHKKTNNKLRTTRHFIFTNTTKILFVND